MGNEEKFKLMVKMEISFDKQRVSDLLCSALEGGSNYWYMIESFIKPTKVEQVAMPGETFRHLDYPLSEGGALMVSDRNGAPAEEDMKTTRLDWPKLLEGLVLMAEKYPRHFGDWMAENDDADTGDVFLQLCVLGEVVYG
jgi:hypothetical protein